MRDVGPVVIGSPSGLGLEIQTSVSEVEIVIAEDSFSGRFSLFGRVALGKSDKKPFARHSAIGNLDEASFFRLQKGLWEWFFPDDFSGVRIEADGVNVLPEIFGGFASGGVIFQIRVAAFEKAELSIGKRNSGIDR